MNAHLLYEATNCLKSVPVVVKLLEHFPELGDAEFYNCLILFAKKRCYKGLYDLLKKYPHSSQHFDDSLIRMIIIEDDPTALDIFTAIRKNELLPHNNNNWLHIAIAEQALECVKHLLSEGAVLPEMSDIALAYLLIDTTEEIRTLITQKLNLSDEYLDTSYSETEA